jgi:O-antigen/teichoic acid export membrane protein
MSRVENATRNIFFGYLGTIVTTLLAFIARTVFIHTLGVTFLGVNGLYVNILSVLSLAELGIGTAMNYSLYKPVAERDYEKIKSLMQLYKRTYRVIALIVAIMGLILVPFLKYVIKDTGSIGNNHLIAYYLIFLFNTVSTYFIAYKYSLVNAEQKGYIQTNIHAITTLITVIAQIIVLLVYKNFLFYLLTTSVIGLIQKIYVNIYLNKVYPYLLDKDTKLLSKDEIAPIKKNIIALIYHKIGEISVHQTDNIIISSFINVTTVGLISNYNLIIASISGFINIIFNSVLAGFGNLIVTESKEKQYEVFKVYRFLGFWIYGFASIAFLILITPFIELWIGTEMVIRNTVIYLIITNYYFLGHRVVINNFKTAAGVFDADKYIAITQAVVNLIVSIIMVRLVGLAGVYIGTIASGLVSTFTRPFIVYKKIFNRSVLDYYKDSFIYVLVLGFTLMSLELIKDIILIDNTVSRFIMMAIIVAVIPNIIFYIFFRNREEFQFLFKLVKSRIFGRR